MKRIIRLTESQFRKVITEALLKEVENRLSGITWDSLMDEAKKLYHKKIKPIKDRHDRGWWKKDDGSEDYQIYSELWDRYCDLVWKAQQAFLREYKEYGAMRAQDVHLTPSVSNIVEPNKTAWQYKEKFLFDYLLYLEDYKEMGNYNPMYKYLVVTEMGGPNGYEYQDRYKVRATYPGEEREWDLSNYDIVPGNRKDSRTRGTQHSLMRKTTKNQAMNNQKYRTTFVNDKGEKVDAHDPEFTKKDAEDYTINTFGWKYNQGHGYPATR